MGNKVSIVDLVHALFKSNVVDICKKEETYLLGTRLDDKKTYNDGREVLYTFDVRGLGSAAQILEKLGISVSPERPYFKEGDKELIAQAILEDVKKRHANWSEFLDDHVVFKKGGKGYAP